jgi:hypothetical protein
LKRFSRFGEGTPTSARLNVGDGDSLSTPSRVKIVFAMTQCDALKGGVFPSEAHLNFQGVEACLEKIKIKGRIRDGRS